MAALGTMSPAGLADTQATFSAKNLCLAEGALEYVTSVRYPAGSLALRSSLRGARAIKIGG